MHIILGELYYHLKQAGLSVKDADKYSKLLSSKDIVDVTSDVDCDTYVKISNALESYLKAEYTLD